MDEFNTDIFTFRRSDAGIADDVIVKAGFRNDDLLDNLTDVELQDVAPYVFGYHHLSFH
jgi:hypothetical protein